MNIHALSAAPPPELAAALEKFEAQFRYPLGPGRFFRISHGEDYPRFFRAMGDGVCFVAERGGEVLGVIGAAIRPLIFPDGVQRPTVYLGDAKVDPAVRGGRTLVRLSAAVQAWYSGRTDRALAVVMDGTPVNPTQYTGRLGIPPAVEIGKIMILRLPTANGSSVELQVVDWTANAARGTACYRRLSMGRFACLAGNPAERSEMAAQWFVNANGTACGMLEDTRRAKRLIADDDVEMVSAHLSCFAYEDASAGVELLHVARGIAAQRGLPAMFVSVAAADADDFCRRLDVLEPVKAPATIYGAGLDNGYSWNINTAEI